MRTPELFPQPTIGWDEPLERIILEMNLAEDRFKFYAIKVARYHVVVLILNILSILLPIVAVAFLFSSLRFNNHLAGGTMMFHILVVLLKLHFEKLCALFSSATFQAGDQWEKWNVSFERIQRGEELDWYHVSHLLRVDRSIYTRILGR